MGRPLRIEYIGALYHVMAHGNGMQWIFNNNTHLILFKQVLKEIIKKYKFKMHAIVLMRNHYHILLEIQSKNLSAGMKKLNQDFARLFNKITNRKGSIFRDRYKAILIEKENYYWSVLRYICQNPVRQKIVKQCEDYKGSFLNWLNDADFENYIYFDEIKHRFNSEEGNWFNNFLDWVNDGIESNPMTEVKTKYLLGTEEWLKKIAGRVDKIKLSGKIHQKKKYFELKLNNAEIKKILKETDEKAAIDIQIYIYVNYSSITFEELYKKMNLCSASACSQRYYRFKKRLKEDKNLQGLLKEIENVNC